MKVLHKLMLLCILLLIAAQTAAQTAAQSNQERQDIQVLTIEEVMVTYDADTGLTLKLQVIQNDGCDFPLTVSDQSSPGVLLIEIKRDIAALTDQPCVSEPVAVELDVQINDETLSDVLAESDMLYLVVNDLYFRLPAVGEGDQRAFGELQSLTREDVGIEHASIETIEPDEVGEFVLIAEGLYATTCLTPDIVRQSVDGGTFKIEIFKLVPVQQMEQAEQATEECPQTFAPPTYEGRIPLTLGSADTEPMPLSGAFVVDVNGYQLTYDFDNRIQGEAPVKGMIVDTVIESTEVLLLESFPPQLVLNVTGYHPDGCQFPVQIDQTQEGNTIKVHIYREVPPNVRCTMNIVGYEAGINLGSFDPGTYTIDVNGTLIEVQL